jgi:hypothetical protein
MEKTVSKTLAFKEDAIAKSQRTQEKRHHQCCSIKRLVGKVIVIVVKIPLECADDTNIYVFWVFQTKVESRMRMS